MIYRNWQVDESKMTWKWKKEQIQILFQEKSYKTVKNHTRTHTCDQGKILTFTFSWFRSATRFTFAKFKWQTKEGISQLTGMADRAITDGCCTLSTKFARASIYNN
jgi:catalase